jgi:hypothetical protein
MAVTVAPYLITIDPGTYTAFDLWDTWRDWVMLGNAQYLPAFVQSGGAPLTGSNVQPLYLFLQNQYGWRITSSDPTAYVTLDVNLYGQDSGTPIYSLVSGVMPPIQIERSVKAAVIATGGSALTTDEHNQLDALHKSAMNRRSRDTGSGVITLYDDDGVAVFREFDSTADLSEIAPR